ncbi:MAG: HD domain-containing protein [Salinivirgaceae bacterium]|nr:HD domain-containing protein [Salinivirgaceae bacterium]MDD4747734.1 HD domain-containing protein [Salinivirgaceae bacterium]MDY0281623.1 HD domain-containing protein [Salinivirgaceae bacterium]
MLDVNTIFEEIESDFMNYIDCYIDDEEDPEYRRLMELKKDHSMQVSAKAESIAQAENFESRMILLCKVAGMLHDIGRFEQIQIYGTLDDLNSVDHGDLGYEVLSNTGFLEHFETVEQLALLFAVKNHNKRLVDDYPNEITEVITKVTRDADKLDVFRVMFNSLEEHIPEHTNAVLLGLTESDDVTNDVADYIESGKLVNKEVLVTTTDFYLMQLSWVFDLNFKSTLKKIKGSEYFQNLSDRLPDNDRVVKLKSIVFQHITNQS